MYSKFENFMKKYLAPLADKMDKEVHLSAVKKAMVAMTPLLIIGSFCLIPEAIPNMIGEKHVISQWILTRLLKHIHRWFYSYLNHDAVLNNRHLNHGF